MTVSWYIETTKLLRRPILLLSQLSRQLALRGDRRENAPNSIKAREIRPLRGLDVQPGIADDTKTTSI